MFIIFLFIGVLSCHKQNNLLNLPEDLSGAVTAEPNLISEISQDLPELMILPYEPTLGKLMVEVQMDQNSPNKERFRDSWYVGVHNIDDHGRKSGPTYYGMSDQGGKVDIYVPKEVLKYPMLINAQNDVFPIFPKGTVRAGQCISLLSFVPANCYQQRLPVNQLTDASWRYLYSLAARRGAENWTPSNVDCKLWAKLGILLENTREIQDVLDQLSNTDTMIIGLDDLTPALQKYPEFIYKTRPPLCIAERRHNGGGMREGIIIEPTDLIHSDEERYIHNFRDPEFIGDSFEYFRDVELAQRRRGNTVTVGENGLIRTLCANSEPDQVPELSKNMFLRTSFQVNGQILGDPDHMYDFDDKNFFGHVANWQNPGDLQKIDIKAYTVRHTNGFSRDHDKYSQVCSATMMAEFTNTDDVEQDLLHGTGFYFADLFDKAGADLDDNFELGAKGIPDTDAAVWFTSSGNQTIENEDRWAILFDSDPLAVFGILLGICNPNIFCDEELLELVLDFIEFIFPGFDIQQFFDVIPNFPIGLIQEALIVELPGHRAEDFRDVLRLDFDEASEDLFIGLRANYELNEEASDGEQAFFGATLTYINQKNVRDTLALCYEAADYLTRQQIDVLFLKDEIPLVLAAGMIARSRCFSNSLSNQRWQNFHAGIWSMNGHRGVNPNLIIPAGWSGFDMTYEVYLKKFDESVFKGPITTFNPEPFGGSVLEIATITEGDELLVRAVDSCCDRLEYAIPCVAEPMSYEFITQKMLIDTSGVPDKQEEKKPEPAQDKKKKSEEKYDNKKEKK